MKKTRYEIYEHEPSALPFTLLTNLERSPRHFSEEANWHDALEIEWYKSGSGIALIDGERVCADAGDLIIVNSYAIHRIIPNEELTYTCLIIDYKFCKQAGIDVNENVFEIKTKDKIIIEKIKELEVICADEKDELRIAKAERTLLDILIILKKDHVTDKKADNSVYKNERIKNAIAYIRSNLGNKLTLDDIARNVFVDKYVLCREFKKNTGQTVIEYINNYRCKAVAELITDGKSVSEAAASCGFGNMSYFTETFKKYFKKLPSEFIIK